MTLGSAACCRRAVPTAPQPPRAPTHRACPCAGARTVALLAQGRLRDGASQVAVSDIALTLVEGGDKRMLHEAVVRPRRQLQSGTCFLTDPTPDAFLLVALIGPLSGGQTADVVRFVSSPPNTVPHPATLPYQPHATPCHTPHAGICAGGRAHRIRRRSRGSHGERTARAFPARIALISAWCGHAHECTARFADGARTFGGGLLWSAHSAVLSAC